MKTLSPIPIKRSLLVYGVQAQVIEQRIEFDGLTCLGINVLVITSGGCIGGRKGQRFFYELVAKLSKLGGSNRTRRRSCRVRQGCKGCAQHKNCEGVV